MASPSEEWRPVVGYEGLYEVSDLGRVKRVAAGQGATPGIRKQSTHPSGYKQVSLSKGNRQRTHKAHRLVLEAFVGPRPEGMESCHANDIPGDNRLENLRWGTRRENLLERDTNGKPRSPERPRASCRQGHAYPAEPRRDYNGYRVCEPCYTAKRARNRKHPEGFCRKGHEMTAENTYTDRREKRQCRECRRAADHRRRNASRPARHGKAY